MLIHIVHPVNRVPAPPVIVNQAPTDITLSGTTIFESATPGTAVGTLTGIDSDDTSFTWAIVNGNTKFEFSSSIGGSTTLQRSSIGTLVAGVNESVQVRITDSANNTFTKTFTITVSASAGTVIDSLTIFNDTASIINANFVTDFIGLAFKQGDIPAGSMPRIELQAGTVCPATFGPTNLWPDGSLKNLYAILRVPASVPASGTLVLNIKNNGTVPLASGFTTANFNATAGRDLKYECTGFENLSGVWISAVNQGIIDNDRMYTDSDGEAGQVRIIEQQVMQSGADHADLQVKHYIAALKDQGGGVFGWLWMPQPGHVDYNSASPTRRAFDMRLLDGATEIPSTDYFSEPRAVTYAGVNARLTLANHGLQRGEAVRFTTNGTLFTGLTTSAVYFIKPIDANTVEIWNDPTALDDPNQTTTVVFTSAGGSGTQTIRRVCALDHYAGAFGALKNGNCQFIPGTGTRPNIRVYQSKAYLKSTRLFLPYDLNLTPNAGTSITYAPNCAGDLRRFIGAAGGSPTIGPAPTWVARHFMRRTALDEQITRVNSLALGHKCIWLRDATTRMPPVYNGGTYTGLPANSNTIRYNGSAAGGPGVSGVNVPLAAYNFYSSNDTSHWCAGPHYAILIFGAPWFREIQIGYSNCASLGRGKGESNPSAPGFDPNSGEGATITISGTTYRATGLFFGASLERVDAWTFREQVAAFLLPTNHPNGTQMLTYLRDCAAGSAAAFTAWRNTRTVAYRTNGIWEWCTRANGQGSPWAKNYLTTAAALGYAYTNLTDFQTMAQHFANFMLQLRANGGLWHANAYIMHIRTVAGGNASQNVIDDISLVTFEAYSCTTDAATDVITITPFTGSPAIANNDRVSFNSDHYVVPGGLTGFNVYYAVQVSGNTCKLSLTPGGAAIDITTSVSTTASWQHLAAGTGPAGSQGLNATENFQDGYTGVARGAALQLQALGIANMNLVVADLNTIFGNAPAGNQSFLDNPKNALTGSFTS